MRKIDIEHYSEPTDEQVAIYGNKLAAKKIRYRDVSKMFAMFLTSSSLAISFFLLYQDALWHPLSYSSLFVAFYVAICCMVASHRCQIEVQLLHRGDFVIRPGYIRDVEKKNSWSDIITVHFDEKYNDKPLVISRIGKDIKKGQKVFVIIPNQEKASWVLPRIILR